VAARNGNLKIVQLLATYGADVSTEATLMDAPTRGPWKAAQLKMSAFSFLDFISSSTRAEDRMRRT